MLYKLTEEGKSLRKKAIAQKLVNERGYGWLAASSYASMQVEIEDALLIKGELSEINVNEDGQLSEIL